MSELNIFIRNNNLSSRWRQLTDKSTVFTLGEIGFNLDENFSSCVELWLKIVKPGPRLHYLAGIQTPIPHDCLEKLINTESLAMDSAKYLVSQYHPRIENLQTLYFLDDRIRLSLFVGNPQKFFEELGNEINPRLAGRQRPSVDAWFVRETHKNMWSQLARLSFSKTSFAVLTETRDSTQKRLANAGFTSEVEHKVTPRFSIISGNYAPAHANKFISDGISHWQIDKDRKNKTSRRDVTVVGAGIAGCATAYALVKRGYKVSVIDRYALPGGEASGHHHSILYPKLSFRPDPVPRINLRAILYASAYYESFWKDKIGGKCGVILLPRSDIEEEQYRAISEDNQDNEKFVRFVASQDLEAISGIKLKSNGGLFFANLGWLPSVEVCKKLIAQSDTCFIQSDIENIVYNPKEESWTLFDRKGSVVKECPILVLACSHGCLRFEQTKYLPVKKVHGQISYLPATHNSKKLNTIICGHGYLAPAQNNIHCCGATYNKDVINSSITINDHKKNLEIISKTDFELGKLFSRTPPENLAGWAQFRCTTSDYLPIVGPVPDVERMVIDFHALRSNARAAFTESGSYLKNLYINCGLGSRGLSYAPLTAEILASDIANEFPPLERDLRLAMHPARFIIRDLKKRKL